MNHLVHRADGEPLSKRLPVLMQRRSKFLIFTPLDVHATFWIIVCNQGLDKYLNGSLALAWVFMLVVLLRMLPMLA